MGNGGSKVGKSKVYREGNHRNFAACFYEHPNFESENNGDTGWGCENRGEWADGPYAHHNDKYSSATVQPGNVAVIYEHRDFQGDKRVLGPGEHPDFGTIGFHDKNSSIRILPDCNDWNHVWNGECDKRRDIFPNLDNTRKEYCNHNQDHAFRNECNNWCANRGGDCVVRDRFLTCKKYEIPDGECNENNIIEMRRKCFQYQLINSQNEPIGGAVCTNKGITDLLNECRQYIPKYISSESACTSTSIAEAKRLKQADEAAELQRKQAAEEAERNRKAQEEAAAKLVEAQRESDRKRAEETKRLQEETKKQREEAQKKTEAMILSIVDPSALPPNLQQRALSEQNGAEKNKMMIIIAVVVVILLCLISMSFLMMGGDE